MWKIVKTKARRTRMAKAKGRRKESRRERCKGEEIKKGKNNECKESNRGMGNLG